MASRRTWARWATGSSFFLLLLAVVSLFQVYPSLMSTFDPESNYLVKVEPGQESDFTVDQYTRLVALRVNEGSVPQAELRLFGGNGEEIGGRGAGTFDPDRPGSDGSTIYSPVRIFEAVESGGYTLHNDAEDLQLWLVDETELAEEIDGNPWLYLFYIGCCLGAPIGLVGLILAVIVWTDKRKAPDQFLVIQDGSVILTDMEKVQSVRAQKEGDLEIEEGGGVPRPFVSTGPSNESTQPDQEGQQWKSWDDAES